MPNEPMGSSFETPKTVENLDSSISRESDLGFKEVEKPVERKSEAPDAGSFPKVSLPVSAPVMTEYEQRQKQIEDFLSYGLENAYLSLPADKRAEFKRTGEETAAKINQLLDKAKVNIGKIVLLIRKWLALLPGVSKLFLEQEAKIRADEVIKLKRLE
jgi:hypothetical protein